MLPPRSLELIERLRSDPRRAGLRPASSHRLSRWPCRHRCVGDPGSPAFKAHRPAGLSPSQRPRRATRPPVCRDRAPRVRARLIPDRHAQPLDRCGGSGSDTAVPSARAMRAAVHAHAAASRTSSSGTSAASPRVSRSSVMPCVPQERDPLERSTGGLLPVAETSLAVHRPEAQLGMRLVEPAVGPGEIRHVTDPVAEVERLSGDSAAGPELALERLTRRDREHGAATDPLPGEGVGLARPEPDRHVDGDHTHVTKLSERRLDLR